MQTKHQKVEVITKLANAFKSAASVVFVHFNGMNVADETAMRRALRQNGVSYTVAKKTLVRRALEGAGHTPSEVPLEGELAVAHGGGDSILAARLIHEFAKKFTDPGRASKLAIVGGIFEGKLVGQKIMQAIAMIPPLETLRAMFAQVINSPRQRFAVALSKVADKKS